MDQDLQMIVRSLPLMGAFAVLGLLFFILLRSAAKVALSVYYMFGFGM